MKQAVYRSKKLLDYAKECPMCFGCGEPNDGSVVAAHSNQQRDGKGMGFTHKVGDVVTISTPSLGRLVNRVRLSTECAPWSFGSLALMRNLAARGMLRS